VARNSIVVVEDKDEDKTAGDMKLPFKNVVVLLVMVGTDEGRS
jgi:hypothetical protein